jgi:voltage-gated potassium channel
LFYSSIFLVDYILSFYTSEDTLRFFFNYMSLVDLVSIVTPFIYVFVQTPSQWVWFLGFIRISRATRIFRTYRLLSFAQSEETREFITFGLNFFSFIFFSASLINATESLVIAVEGPPSLKKWHDSLYYIMVTFSTIGFGDLTPSSTVS